MAEAPVAEEPDAELGKADRTPDSSVPLALAFVPVYLIALTPVPFVHAPGSADVKKMMSAH